MFSFLSCWRMLHPWTKTHADIKIHYCPPTNETILDILIFPLKKNSQFNPLKFETGQKPYKWTVCYSFTLKHSILALPNWLYCSETLSKKNTNNKGRNCFLTLWCWKKDSIPNPLHLIYFNILLYMLLHDWCFYNL